MFQIEPFFCITEFPNEELSDSFSLFLSVNFNDGLLTADILTFLSLIYLCFRLKPIQTYFSPSALCAEKKRES